MPELPTIDVHGKTWGQAAECGEMCGIRGKMCAPKTGRRARNFDSKILGLRILSTSMKIRRRGPRRPPRRRAPIGGPPGGSRRAPIRIIVVLMIVVLSMVRDFLIL